MDEPSQNKGHPSLQHFANLGGQGTVTTRFDECDPFLQNAMVDIDIFMKPVM
jgi:hypothetical protein